LGNRAGNNLKKNLDKKLLRRKKAITFAAAFTARKEGEIKREY